MTRAAFLLAFLIALARPAPGCPVPLSPAEIGGEAAFLALLAADTRLTIDFRERLNLVERNPLVGPRPDRRRMNQILGVVGLGHLLVTCYLSPAARPAWLVVTIGLEVGAVSQNLAAGAHLHW